MLDEGCGTKQEPDVWTDKLRSSNIFQLTVTGLNESGKLYGPGSLEKTFSVPGGATFEQIQSIVEHAGE